MKVNVELEIPDDGWIEASSYIKPKEGEICVIIYEYGNKTPLITQYTNIWPYGADEPVFLDITEPMMRQSEGDDLSEWNPSWCTWDIISHWKPLGLPKEIDERMKKMIEGWFDDEEN